ncbi:DegT/DnrJ/EryC1/StrS family aminotransferase [Candidatus Latescibacterota bacterium]
MKRMIPHSKPFIDSHDIRAVVEVLESGMLAGDKKVREFESALAGCINRTHAAGTSNGTSALYAVLSAIGVGDGDDVVIPSYVCSSLLYAVRMTGANPVIADSGDDPFHIDADTVKKVLTPKVKVIIFPHLFGSANDIRDITSLGIPVVEDCALSLGSELNGVKTGNLGSSAAVFSFYATKVIAAGEGGMVVSDDKILIDRIRDLTEYADKPDNRMHFNFKMTDIAAALGLSQLQKLDSMIERRRELAHRYSKALASTDLILPVENRSEKNIFYRYVVRTEHVEKLRNLIRQRGVSTERPVHMPLSRYPGISAVCPRAEEIWRTSLSIPLYPALSDKETEMVEDAVYSSINEINEGD